MVLRLPSFPRPPLPVCKEESSRCVVEVSTSSCCSSVAILRRVVCISSLYCVTFTHTYSAHPSFRRDHTTNQPPHLHFLPLPLPPYTRPVDRSYASRLGVLRRASR